MKRYLIFVLFVVVTSSSVFGQTQTSKCIITNFYTNGTTNIINEVIYNTKFDVELAVTYNPTDVATDKLAISVTLPAGDYSQSPQLQVFSSTVTISNQIFSNNTVTFDVTGFSNIPFTIIVANVRFYAGASCTDPAMYPISSSFGYYPNSTSTTPVNFQNNSSSKSISGKHTLGTIAVALSNSTNYSPTADAKSPFYVDLIVSTTGSTYLNNDLLLNFTSSQTIRTVVYNTSIIASGQNTGGITYYQIPNPAPFTSVIRVYFDLAENTQAVNLGLSCTAKFVSTCTITGNSFSNSIAVPTFTGKPDNDLLTYPSINSNQVNYYPETLVLPCPNQNTIVGFYLDNIYNQSAMQSPIVTTFDLPANVVAQSLFFSGPIPDQISVRNCSTGLYQVLTYGTTGSVIIPDGTSIDNIKMTYNQLPIIRSMVSLTFQTAVLPRSCSGSVSSIAYSLLKDNQVYLTEAVVYVSPPGQGNSLSINYSTNIYSPGQPDIMPVFIQTVVWNTMKHDDYLLYTLDENMDFSDPSNQNNLLFSFNPGTNYQTLAAFNAQYFSSNPMIVQISGRTLKIQNISIPGYISDCNLQNFSLFFRVVTKVADKPTKIDNVNTLALRDKNDVLLPLSSIAPYTWHVQSTQKINPDVFFSCNDGLTKNSGITIKKDDEVNVYYTLENTNLLKYDQKAVVMYGSLITSVAKPSIQLIKTDGTTHVASVIDPSLYTVTYAGGSPGNYSTLLYGNTFNVNSTNIFQISIPLITINAYDKIEAALTYSSGLGLSSNSEVFINAIVGSFPINSVNRSLTIGPKSDCDLFNCTECITSFSPTAGEEYVLSAWVKESFTGNPPTTYANSGVRVTFNDGAINTLALFRPTGPIVDGWQRIEVSFVVPVGANNIHITLVNESPNTDVFFDDIRIHPYNSNMKSFVYDPSTQKLVAELDENNFATLYEYDDEGILIRVKKETERGVMTIKETRSNQSKIQNGQ